MDNTMVLDLNETGEVGANAHIEAKVKTYAGLYFKGEPEIAIAHAQSANGALYTDAYIKCNDLFMTIVQDYTKERITNILDYLCRDGDVKGASLLGNVLHMYIDKDVLEKVTTAIGFLEGFATHVSMIQFHLQSSLFGSGTYKYSDMFNGIVEECLYDTHILGNKYSIMVISPDINGLKGVRLKLFKSAIIKFFKSTKLTRKVTIHPYDAEYGYTKIDIIDKKSSEPDKEAYRHAFAIAGICNCYTVLNPKDGEL